MAENQTPDERCERCISHTSAPLSPLVRGLVYLERLLAWPLIGLVAFYRKFISPGLPPACRYYPSCSAYADEALRRYGLFRGGALMSWRLLRCNPFTKGGVDFVPGTHRDCCDATHAHLPDTSSPHPQESSR